MKTPEEREDEFQKYLQSVIDYHQERERVALERLTRCQQKKPIPRGPATSCDGWCAWRGHTCKFCGGIG